MKASIGHAGKSLVYVTLAIGAGDDHFRAGAEPPGFGEHIAAWRSRQGDVEQHRGDGWENRG